MDKFAAIKNALESFINPAPQKIISPLGGSDTLNTPGLQYYSQMQQAINQMPKSPSPQIQQPQPSPDQGNIFTQAVGHILGTNTPPEAQAQSIGYPEGASQYEKQAASIFDKYGVPPAIGLGMYAMEGRGKTINPNNPYNIGAYDSNPQNAKAYGFKDPLQGTEEAAKFLAGQSKYQAPDKAKIFQQALNAYKQNGDQDQYLQTIAPTYASNPNYVKTIMQTPEYQRWSYNGN